MLDRGSVMKRKAKIWNVGLRKIEIELTDGSTTESAEMLLSFYSKACRLSAKEGKMSPVLPETEGLVKSKTLPDTQRSYAMPSEN